MGRNLNIVAACEPKRAGVARTAACPACQARLTYRRSALARIDACGFESYALDCGGCGATLVGIIDPLDDALLVTAVTPSMPVAKIAPTLSAPTPTT
jgi:hypothetical protein